MTNRFGPYYFILLLAMTSCRRYPPIPFLATPTAVERKVIVMMAGQSNMLGIGQDGSPGCEYFQANPSVKMIQAGGDAYSMMGPGAAAGLFYVRAHPGVTFIGIMCAKSSTSINEWQAGGQLLEVCLARVKLVRDQEQAPVVGLFFDQGEQDAYLNDAPDWPQKLTALARYCAQNLGLSTLPVIYSQLGQTDNTYNGQWEPFQEMQAQTQAPGFSMVVTDDLPAIGHVHHDSAANLEIGRRFFVKMPN